MILTKNELPIRLRLPVLGPIIAIIVAGVFALIIRRVMLGSWGQVPRGVNALLAGGVPVLASMLFFWSARNYYHLSRRPMPRVVTYTVATCAILSLASLVFLLIFDFGVRK